MHTLGAALHQSLGRDPMYAPRPVSRGLERGAISQLSPPNEAITSSTATSPHCQDQGDEAHDTVEIHLTRLPRSLGAR